MNTRAKIRALIVDDEPLARERMARLLGAHPDVEVVGQAGDAGEMDRLVRSEQPDVLFLDIHMPGTSGTEALRALRRSTPPEELPLVVFTTAHEEHAVEAFDLEGADYLLKPVEPARLELALERLRQRLSPEDAAAEAPDSGFLAAWRGGEIVSLGTEEIACVTVENTLTLAHTARGACRLRMTLTESEGRLPNPPFVRVSRGAIVNLQWIEKLEPRDSGTFVLRLRAPLSLELGVSRRRARELRRLLGW